MAEPHQGQVGQQAKAHAHACNQRDPKLITFQSSSMPRKGQPTSYIISVRLSSVFTVAVVLRNFTSSFSPF